MLVHTGCDSFTGSSISFSTSKTLKGNQDIHTDKRKEKDNHLLVCLTEKVQFLIFKQPFMTEQKINFHGIFFVSQCLGCGKLYFGPWTEWTKIESVPFFKCLSSCEHSTSRLIQGNHIIQTKVISDEQDYRSMRINSTQSITSLCRKAEHN